MLNVSYCSDKYQYTMGKSFYDSQMGEKRAVFNLFFRKAPDNNNWAVVCGIEEALEMIRGLGNMPEEFFEKFLPGEEYAEYRKYLANMRFTGNVYAMKEGEIAFPKQPIITIEGPLIEAQVLETPLLCIMNHQMAIATKASRVTRATNKPVSEFGSRRAHGPWAATYGAKAAYIGGCANSSNILAAANFGFPCAGTMAHSYVTSFGNSIHGEYKAFDTYIKTHPGEPLILLVDTYDTLHCGITNAIRAYKNNNIDDSYPNTYGIRLDSGDLAYLSTKCRKELDQAGLKNCKIFATNSLDEYIITDLERQEACIDSYGVGDAIATSKHNPCFGNVYKLVEIDNQPILKRSEDKAKLINPGFQITYRIIRNGIHKVDVTCLRGDKTAQLIEAGESVLLRSESDKSKYNTYNKGEYEAKPLQIQMMKDGEVCYTFPHIDQRRNYYLSNLESFNHTETRIINPHYYKVDISDELYDCKMELIDKIIADIEILKKSRQAGKSTLVVVDMLYDFIDGSLACQNGEEAVKATVEYMNIHPELNVLYVCDSHPADHCSFQENGGIWPAHCVQGTRGAEIHEAFYKDVLNHNIRPQKHNMYLKGCNPQKEQYSGYEAVNASGISIEDASTHDIIIAGIASEYCVMETAMDFIRRGFNVSIIVGALAYVDKAGHEKAIAEFRSKGINLLY